MGKTAPAHEALVLFLLASAGWAPGSGAAFCGADSGSSIGVERQSMAKAYAELAIAGLR